MWEAALERGGRVGRGAMVRQGAVPCGPVASQGGATSLVRAASGGHTDTVELLLDRGADLEAKKNVMLPRLFILPCHWSAGNKRIGCNGLALFKLESWPQQIAVHDAYLGERLDCFCFGQRTWVFDCRLARTRWLSARAMRAPKCFAVPSGSSDGIAAAT